MVLTCSSPIRLNPGTFIATIMIVETKQNAFRKRFHYEKKCTISKEIRPINGAHEPLDYRRPLCGHCVGDHIVSKTYGRGVSCGNVIPGFERLE